MDAMDGDAMVAGMDVDVDDVDSMQVEDDWRGRGRDLSIGVEP